MSFLAKYIGPLFLIGYCILIAILMYAGRKSWNTTEVDETWDKPFL